MELTEPVVRALVERYARLLERTSGELGERPLVLPTGAHFPDHFSGDEKSVRRLVSRMRAHAGMQDIPLQTHLIAEDDESSGTGGCGTGTCSTPSAPRTSDDLPRLVDEGESGWRLNVPAAEVEHPVVLTTNVARALGTVFLVETRDASESIEEPVDVTVELTAVALGFGVILLDGSYIYAKSCGGPRVARATRLGPSELGVLTALFAALGKHSTRAAHKHLEVTQRTALAAGTEWFASNRELIELLHENPARVARGDFTLSDPKPWLARLFGKKKRAADPLEAALAGDASAEELDSLLTSMPMPSAQRAPKQRDPKLDELRQLVDEALSGGSS